MSWGWRAFAVWAPFAVLAVVVLASCAVGTAIRRRAERRQPHGVGTDVVEPPPPPPPPPPPAPSASTAELRRWAKSAGLRIADRGPIPAQVREAWSRAHGLPPVSGSST